jgi:competence protein ComEC
LLLAIAGGCGTDTDICVDPSRRACHDGGRVDGESEMPLDSADSGQADTGLSALGTLEIHMIDVWQGDSIVLVGPTGKTMLVDAGDEAEYSGLVRHLMQNGLTEIDSTVVSHMHADHMGAMDLVLADHPEVQTAYDGGSTYWTSSYDDYIAAADPVRQIVHVGDVLPFDDNVSIEVLHADIGDSENENNNSVVLKVTHGEITILLGGDCEGLLCESAIHPGPIDVYKVHHHGSSDSSKPRLLQEMKPSIALIGVGEGNDYGHPYQGTLDDLEAIGATVYRTDLNGSIVVESDGKGLTVEAER